MLENMDIGFKKRKVAFVAVVAFFRALLRLPLPVERREADGLSASASVKSTDALMAELRSSAIRV